MARTSSMQHILVPVDFSPESKRAAHYAIQLTEQFNPTIEIVHIWDLPEFLGPSPIAEHKSSGSLTLADYTRQQVEEAMVSFVAELEADINEAMDNQHSLRLTKRVEFGKPADAIVKLAQDESFDLIVMGTHGRSGLAHLFMGSVTAAVIRRAPCPVVAVPPKAG